MAEFEESRLARLNPLIGDLLLVPLVMLAAWQLRFGLQFMPADFFLSALALSPLVMLAVVPSYVLVERFCVHVPLLWKRALTALASGVTGALLILLLYGTDKVPRSSFLVLPPLLWTAWLVERTVIATLRKQLPLLGPPLQAARRFSQERARQVGRLATRYWRHALDLLLFCIFLGILYWAFMDRAAWVNDTFGEYIGCDDCLTRALFLHDYLFFGALLLLFLVSFMARRFLLYLPLRLLALAGVLLYVGDIVLMDEFYTRLMFGDLRVYGEQLPLVWRHVTSTEFFAFPAWMLPILLLCAVSLLLLPPVGKASRRAGVILAVLPAVVLTSGSAFIPPSYVQDWALRNVLAANFNTGVAVPYSEDYRQQLLAAAGTRASQCVAGMAQQPDIVLLVLESWSPFQSRQWGGTENWTPQLDRLARNNAWYSRFHAGGFTTNEGLMSLFAGLEFLAPVKSYFSIAPFETAWETPATIPRALEKEGAYHTAFLTSGNLGFTRKGTWLRSIGFDYVEGHDYRGYNGRRRFHFDAPADEHLYARSVDYIGSRLDGDQPLFVAIENVSSHHPYIHPRTGERSAEAVFRYMDGTAYAFYNALREIGFFDNGLLLIVSDHRAMVPIELEEAERFGQMAASRVPAIVVGANLKGEISTPFHQSDVLPSLTAFTSGQFCHTGPYRNMLQPELTEPRCLYHARGDNRDHIDAFCPLPDGSEARAVIGLDGDDTHILTSEGMSAGLEQQVLMELNTHRIVGDERRRRLLESGYFN